MYTCFHSPTQLLDDDAAVGAGADVKTHIRTLSFGKQRFEQNFVREQNHKRGRRGGQHFVFFKTMATLIATCRK